MKLRPDPKMTLTKHTVTLSKRTWLGVLIHLKETVDNIPVSTVSPDPYSCVHRAIKEIEKFVTLED